MYWNPVRDQFEFKVTINFSPKKVRTGPDLTLEQLNMGNAAITKRINGIYDPFGLFVPFTL